jgi:hypothetical protein
MGLMISAHRSTSYLFYGSKEWGGREREVGATGLQNILLLHNSGFWNVCITKRCLHDSRKCVIYTAMILFYNCLWLKNKVIKKHNLFCHVLNNIGFPMKGKFARSKSVLWFRRCRIQRYVAAAKVYKRNKSKEKCFSEVIMSL